MKKPVRFALLLVSVLVASLFVGTPSAQAANPGGCQGQVWELSDVGSQIKLTYRVHCQVTQAHIDVTARLTGGKNGASVENHKVCQQDYVCATTVYMQDWAGSHVYNGWPGTGLYPCCWTLAEGRDGFIVECDRNMPCARESKYF